MDEAQEAIDSLERLGLTEYEAKCFVALTRLPHGTAKEVGRVADIPRSRVYETMERLQNRGLIEIQDGEPRTFQSVSVDATVRILRKQYETYFETAERTLRDLEPVYKETQQAVWAISNHEQVTERVLDLVDDASDELVVIVNDAALLGDELLSYLESASEREVAIYLGTAADGVREAIDDSEIDASLFDSPLVDWFDRAHSKPSIGRVVMADRAPVLVSAVHDEELPGVPNETAAWSDGINHGFATFAERVLTYDLAANADELSFEVVEE